MPTIGDLMTMAIERAQVNLISARENQAHARLDFAYQLFLAVAAKLNGESQFDRKPLDQAKVDYKAAKKSIKEFERQLERLTRLQVHLASPDGKSDLARLEQDIYGS